MGEALHGVGVEAVGEDAVPKERKLFPQMAGKGARILGGFPRSRPKQESPEFPDVFSEGKSLLFVALSAILPGPLRGLRLCLDFDPGSIPEDVFGSQWGKEQVLRMFLPGQGREVSREA